MKRTMLNILSSWSKAIITIIIRHFHLFRPEAVVMSEICKALSHRLNNINIISDLFKRIVNRFKM